MLSHLYAQFQDLINVPRIYNSISFAEATVLLVLVTNRSSELRFMWVYGRNECLSGCVGGSMGQPKVCVALSMCALRALVAVQVVLWTC